MFFFSKAIITLRSIQITFPLFAFVLIPVIFSPVPIAQASNHNIGTTPQNPKTVVAAVPRHWPPQFAINDKGEPIGFAIDVIEEVAQQAGLQIKYLIKDSFAAAVDALRSGEADLIPNSGIIPRRLKNYAFTIPTETFVVSLFVRSDSDDISSVSDLPGNSVGVVETNVGVDLFRNHQDVKVRVYRDVRTAIFELVGGRIDALIYPQPVVLKLVENIGIEDRIKIVGKPLKEIKRGIRFRKESVELHSVFNKATKQFLATPTYQNIYAKWYGQTKPFWTAERISRYMAGFFYHYSHCLIGMALSFDT